MQAEEQVLNGLTGAILVEGIGAYNQRAAQLPERVFMLRDMKLSRNFPASDTAQPAKDISINLVPIRYRGRGRYDPPAVIQMEPIKSSFGVSPTPLQIPSLTCRSFMMANLSHLS